MSSYRRKQVRWRRGWRPEPLVQQQQVGQQVPASIERVLRRVQQQEWMWRAQRPRVLVRE